ncbi:PIN domain-containing protein [Neisseria sp. CCUG12390]|uniref:PIN domain-containing protein n=1 Tax=Neisseria sp. CCUG12390 TaxID=3392035 RepID=UPI003A1024D7
MRGSNKHYAALTIDTSIFEKHGLKLNKGLLAELDQFSDKPIDLILSDIVFLELKSHLHKKEMETRNKVGLALKDASNYLNCCDNDIDKIVLSLGMNLKDGSISDAQLTDFVTKCNVNIIESQQYCDMGTLINLYFSNSAPFKDVGIKKNEFPDAISLLSLEAWANENDKKILAVSSDKDWGYFAEGKDNVDVIDDLAGAIEILNTQTNEALSCIINEIRKDLLNYSNSEIYKRIYSSIEQYLDVPDVYADSAYNYYVDYSSIDLIEVEIFKNSINDDVQVYLVNSNSDGITLSVKCKVYCEVTAHFNFFIWDSIDKEDVALGVDEKTIEVPYTTDVLVYLYGNFLSGLPSMEIGNVEVIDQLGTVEIGSVSPFNHDEYEQFLSE